MRATHTDYKHPRHLRAEGCRGHELSAACDVDVLCVAPSSDIYAKLNRPNLPKWPGRAAFEGQAA